MADEKPVHGTFCWNELMTRDLKTAAKFYSEVVGWQATDSGMPGMDYTIFKAGDKQAAGMMAMPKEIPNEVPPHWMAYIAVDDVDSAAAKTREHGGQVIHGPEDIPDVGRFCVIQDPVGAVVSLISMK
jgi:hypothetical protein